MEGGKDTAVDFGVLGPASSSVHSEMTDFDGDAITEEGPTDRVSEGVDVCLEGSRSRAAHDAGLTLGIAGGAIEREGVTGAATSGSAMVGVEGSLMTSPNTNDPSALRSSPVPAAKTTLFPLALPLPFFDNFGPAPSPCISVFFLSGIWDERPDAYALSPCASASGRNECNLIGRSFRSGNVDRRDCEVEVEAEASSDRADGVCLDAEPGDV